MEMGGGGRGEGETGGEGTFNKDGVPSCVTFSRSHSTLK